MLAFTVKIIALDKSANTTKARKKNEEVVFLHLRFTQNRIPWKVSLRKSVPKKNWNGTRPNWVLRSKDFPQADQVNYFLNTLIAKAEKIEMEFRETGEDIDFKKFRELLFGIKKSEKVLSNCFDEIFQKKMAKGRHQATMIKDEGHYLKLLVFLKWKNENVKSTSWNLKSDKDRNVLKAFGQTLPVSILNERFILDYEQYMRDELDNKQTTIYKGLNFLRQICNVAIQKKWMQDDPFSHYQMEVGFSTPSYNTIEEIASFYQLWKSGLLKTRRAYLHETVKRYLIQFFTGQHYEDLINLKFDEITTMFGRFCFERERVKTGTTYFVPLLKWGQEIIFSEKSDDQVYVVKKISNQKYNDYLKEVMLILGIRKAISSKAARHSFSSALYNFGIEEATVRTMLGHKSRTMTQHYIHINKQRIVNQIDTMEQSLLTLNLF